VKFTEGAIEEILLQTQGYPYFLQEWGEAQLENSRPARGRSQACRPSCFWIRR
jgi:hypothetical protein